MIAPARRRADWDVSEKFTDARSDYRAAKDTRFRSRLTGIASLGSGADYHYRSESEWLRMIEQAREFDRNDQIIGSAIDKLVANVLQEGFTVDPHTGSEELDAALKTEWAEWANDPDMCHSEGEHTFADLERLTLRSTLVDGDHFDLALDSGQIQAIEAHRVRTPSNTRRDVIHGIMLDKRARRRQVWITKEDLDPYRSLRRVSDIRPVDVYHPDGYRQVMHTYVPRRTSQRRGVTVFAPIMDTAGMLDDVQFATLVKQQMAAVVAILRERPDTHDGSDSSPFGDVDTEFTRPLTGINAGLEVTGDPGEKITGFAPDIPSPSYFEHVSMLLTIISVNLDLPMQVVLLDPSKTNFSGWRGAIDQARIRFRFLQRALIQRFHSPVYRWKVSQWIDRSPAIRRLAGQSGLNPTGHRWNAPGWSYIEPLKDATADAYQAANTLNSMRRIQAARGRDWVDVFREAVDDVAQAIEYAHIKALELGEKQIPDVHWSMLYRPPTAGADNLNLAASLIAKEGTSADA